MAFMDDLKTNQRTQILVAGIIFFAISFPLYFNFAASNVDDYEVSGPVGTYEVKGNFTYIEIGAGTETIGDQATATVNANSDSVDLDGKNVVGFRIKLSHSDTESPCAPTATPQPDEISSVGGINENTTSLAGTDTELEESLYWINNSIINTNVSDVSVSDIDEMLDGGSIGYGLYTFEISVNVNTGSAGVGLTVCQNEDSDEEVDWVIELISLDYTTEEVVEEESEDDDSGE